MQEGGTSTHAEEGRYPWSGVLRLSRHKGFDGRSALPGNPGCGRNPGSWRCCVEEAAVDDK